MGLRGETLLADIAVGLFAGLVATQVTNLAQGPLQRMMPDSVGRRERRVRPGASSSLTAARKVAHRLDCSPNQRKVGLLGKAIHFGIGLILGAGLRSPATARQFGAVRRGPGQRGHHVADPGRGRGAGPRPERPQPGLPGFYPRAGLPRSRRLWGGSGDGGRRAWPLGGADARVCITAPANMSFLAMSELCRGRKRLPAFVGACPICFGDLLQRLWPGMRLSRAVKVFGLPLSALSQNLLNPLFIGCRIMRPCRIRSVPLPKAPRSSPLSLWAAGCPTGSNLAFGCKDDLPPNSARLNTCGPSQGTLRERGRAVQRAVAHTDGAGVGPTSVRRPQPMTSLLAGRGSRRAAC